jgi:hypothetical protein
MALNPKDPEDTVAAEDEPAAGSGADQAEPTGPKTFAETKAADEAAAEGPQRRGAQSS